MNNQNKIIYIVSLVNNPDIDVDPIIFYLDIDKKKCLYKYDSSSLSVNLSDNLKLYKIFFNYGKKYTNLIFEFHTYDYRKFKSQDFTDTVQEIIKTLKNDRNNNTNTKE